MMSLAPVIRVIAYRVHRALAQLMAETAAINVTKPYKPRKLKNDAVHRLARQVYKLKSKNPQFKAKMKKYSKQYRLKNKMGLKRRAEKVRDAKQHLPQVHH